MIDRPVILMNASITARPMILRIASISRTDMLPANSRAATAMPANEVIASAIHAPTRNSAAGF